MGDEVPCNCVLDLHLCSDKERRRILLQWMQSDLFEQVRSACFANMTIFPYAISEPHWIQISISYASANNVGFESEQLSRYSLM